VSQTTTTRHHRLKQKSAERREQGKLELHQTILEAAAKLFEEKGYEGFSLRQVAEEIGYSPTTIYLYFKDKDDLLLNVVYDGFKLFGESLQQAYDSVQDPLERLRVVGWAYFHFAMSHPIHYRLMFMQRGEFLRQKPPAGYDSVIDSFGVIQRTIAEGIEAGVMIPGDLRSYSTLIWASVHGVVSLILTSSHVNVNMEEATHLFEMQLDTIKRAYCV
jgi:AcrR family transcriptional regulator